MFEILLLGVVAVVVLGALAAAFALLNNWQVQIFQEANDEREFTQNLEALKVCRETFPNATPNEIKNCIENVNDNAGVIISDPVDGTAVVAVFGNAIGVVGLMTTGALVVGGGGSMTLPANAFQLGDAAAKQAQRGSSQPVTDEDDNKITYLEKYKKPVIFVAIAALVYKAVSK